MVLYARRWRWLQGPGFNKDTAGLTERVLVPGTRSCRDWLPGTWPCTSRCRSEPSTPGPWAAVDGSYCSCTRNRCCSIGAPRAAVRTVPPRWAPRRRRPTGRTRTPLVTIREQTWWCCYLTTTIFLFKKISTFLQTFHRK